MIQRKLESAYCFFAISLIAGAYTYLPAKLAEHGHSVVDPGSQNLYNTFSEILVVIGLVVLLSRHRGELVAVLRNSLAVNVFVALTLASAAWSLDPAITLRRVFTLTMTVGVAYYLAIRFTPSEVIRMVSTATVVAAAASAALAILMPHVGQMSGTLDNPELAGAWDGVFTQKNTLGATMVVACLTTGWLLTQERFRMTRFLALVLCLGVAVMARSRTFQLAIVVMLPLSLLVRSVRLPGLLRLWVFYLLLLGSLVGTVLVISFFGDVMYALGKSPSITGRLPVWGLLVAEIAQRPLLGYGYGSFFVANNADLKYINEVVGWVVPAAHSGYIELAIQLGIIGLLIGVWIAISTALRAFLAIQTGTVRWAQVAAVYVLIVMMTNVVEASLMRSSSLASLLLPYFFCALGTWRRLGDNGSCDRVTQVAGCDGSTY